MYIDLVPFIIFTILLGSLSLFALIRIGFVLYSYFCGWYYKRKNEREMLHNVCEEFYKLKKRLAKYHVYLDKSGNVRKIIVR